MQCPHKGGSLGDRLPGRSSRVLRCRSALVGRALPRHDHCDRDQPRVLRGVQIAVPQMSVFVGTGMTTPSGPLRSGTDCRSSPFGMGRKSCVLLMLALRLREQTIRFPAGLLDGGYHRPHPGEVFLYGGYMGGEAHSALLCARRESVVKLHWDHEIACAAPSASSTPCHKAHTLPAGRDSGLPRTTPPFSPKKG